MDKNNNELVYKGAQVQESGEGYIIPGKCWFFATWDLVKHYIDSEEEL